MNKLPIERIKYTFIISKRNNTSYSKSFSSRLIHIYIYIDIDI